MAQVRPAPLRFLWALLFLLLPLSSAGCLSDLIFGMDDEEVDARLEACRRQVEQEVQKAQVFPRKAVPTPKKGEARPAGPAKPFLLKLNLQNAISLASTGSLHSGGKGGDLDREADPRLCAFRQVWAEAGGHRPGNRVFLGRLDALRRSILSLHTTRHEWDPKLSGTISYVFSNARATGPHVDSGNLTTGLTQKLPFGGSASVSLEGGKSKNYVDGFYRTTTLGLSASISQPLLRGAGLERARESLLQARRNLRYSVRRFELYRQDFTIDVMRRYYDLIRQRHVVKNNRHAFEQARFLLEQTQALYEKLGEKTTLDVLRAELRLQQAVDAVEEAERAYEEDLDSFKEFLGLGPAVKIELRDDRPPLKDVDFDPASAEEAALVNRLDLRNTYEALQDTARTLRYARQDLWPDLDLNVQFSHLPRDYTAAKDFDDIRHWGHNFSASLSLTLPFDRVAERNALRSQLIAFRRQVRDFQLEVDSVRRQVRDGFRNLRRHRRAMANQKRQIEIARRKERKAFLDFKEGEISNRDLVEAQEELRDAENNLIQTQVNHEIVRVSLIRDLGLLRLSGEGGIEEGS
jgi:outer membrane protein TolC